MEKQTIHFNPPLGGHLLEDINIILIVILIMLRMKKLVVRLLLILMLMQILKITI